MTTNFCSPLTFVAVLDPGSGIRDPGSGIRDPGSGMGKNQDPVSGIRHTGDGVVPFLLGFGLRNEVCIKTTDIYCKL